VEVEMVTAQEECLSGFRTIEWKEGKVVMLDQRLLPQREVYREFATVGQVAEAIKKMVIRGAPAIGIAAAMGLALVARNYKGRSMEGLLLRLERGAELLLSTRPTAVNLQWAIRRCLDVAKKARHMKVEEISQLLVEEAQRILREDVEGNVALGDFGASLVPEEGNILTHCNAGALATGGYGTALGVVRSAHRQGKRVRVLACETRPFLQGARLTAWEMKKAGIPVTVIADNMAGHFMKRREVDLVIVGADRIARNGDVANKIGTYTLSVLCKEHSVPFYVAAPLSTFDPSLGSGEEIPIEERDPEEVLRVGRMRIAPEGVSARYPAFDVTPNHLVWAIITEKGILKAPFQERIQALLLNRKV
jgi:methylthioribose-1-phosphate isomerase